MMQVLTQESAMQALDGIKDPCITACGYDISIVDLGLIGKVDIDGRKATVEITFTEPGCMFTHKIITQIEAALTAAGADEVIAVPQWLPMWTEDRMKPNAAKAFGQMRQRYDQIINPEKMKCTSSRMDQAGGSAETSL